MSLSVPIMGGSGGFFPSIFVTGLSETDTVYATKDGKTVRGKWARGMVSGQPLIPVMTSNTAPSGIASASSALGGYEAWRAFDGDETTMAYSDTASFPWCVQYEFENEVKISSFYCFVETGTKSDITMQHAVQISQNGTEWETVWSGSITGGNNASEKGTFYLDEAKTARYVKWVCLSTTGTNTLATSSEALHDFQVYGEVETDGFLISPIRDLGMWTVTATNGEKTVTQDVLIDVATEYEIELYLNRTYLYEDGDEYTELTGGWSDSGYTPYSDGGGWHNNGNIVKNEDSISINTNYTSGASVQFKCVGTNNVVDLSQYNALKAEYLFEGVGYTSVVNISEIATSQYVAVALYGNGGTKIAYATAFTTPSKTNAYENNTAKGLKIFDGAFTEPKSITIYRVWLEE